MTSDENHQLIYQSFKTSAWVSGFLRGKTYQFNLCSVVIEYADGFVTLLSSLSIVKRNVPLLNKVDLFTYLFIKYGLFCSLLRGIYSIFILSKASRAFSVPLPFNVLKFFHPCFADFSINSVTF